MLRIPQGRLSVIVTTQHVGLWYNSVSLFSVYPSFKTKVGMGVGLNRVRGGLGLGLVLRLVINLICWHGIIRVALNEGLTNPIFPQLTNRKKPNTSCDLSKIPMADCAAYSSVPLKAQQCQPVVQSESHDIAITSCTTCTSVTLPTTSHKDTTNVDAVYERVQSS